MRQGLASNRLLGPLRRSAEVKDEVALKNKQIHPDIESAGDSDPPWHAKHRNLVLSNGKIEIPGLPMKLFLNLLRGLRWPRSRKHFGLAAHAIFELVSADVNGSDAEAGANQGYEDQQAKKGFKPDSSQHSALILTPLLQRNQFRTARMQEGVPLDAGRNAVALRLLIFRAHNSAYTADPGAALESSKL